MITSPQFVRCSLLVKCLVFILGICVFEATVAYAAEESKPDSRPNVLFIAVDDLNDWIEPLAGHPQALTPQLAQFAEESMIFTRAYCAAPLCNPSRTSVLTGLRPSTTGVYGNGQNWRRAAPEAVVLPVHFRNHGYHTAGAGKIFHRGKNDDNSFEEYLEQQPDPIPEGRPLNGIATPRNPHVDWGPVDVDDSEMGDAKAVDWGIEFLKQPHSKPFFLAVGIYRPHLPWYVPRKHFDLFPREQVKLPQVLANDLDDIPPIGLKLAHNGNHPKIIRTNNWHRAVQSYLASIHFADAQIGRLLAALRESRFHENTIVVLWSDHGWHLGEKEHWRKKALWEEATRVVLMISTPGSPRAGERCERTVSLLDLYPTLCELCGLPVPQMLEGESLTAQLDNPRAVRETPAITTQGAGNHAVRSERYRYIRYADGGEELYDHQNDPLEWHNLAAQPQHAALKKSMAAWLPKVNRPAATRNTRPNQGAGH